MIKRYNSRRLTEGTSLWSWMESEPNVPTILEGCGLVFINDKIKECSTGVCYVGKFDDLDIFYNMKSQEELRSYLDHMYNKVHPWVTTNGVEKVVLELPDGTKKF